ncbi:uncharacterized [Tachysurus ichikawai]
MTGAVSGTHPGRKRALAGWRWEKRQSGKFWTSCHFQRMTGAVSGTHPGRKRALAGWRWEKTAKSKILDHLSLPENDRGRLWDSPRPVLTRCDFCPVL